jgi:glycosyltransferase involved in cell wall biosynthesis
VQGHTALAAFVRGRLPIDPYEVEQVAFGIALCAYLIRTRPNVLVLHDVLVAKVVARLPRRLRPAVVFVNGAPWPAPYPFADVVEHVTEPSRVEALRAGGDPERNLVVPCLVPVVGPPTCTERSDARRRLGVPMDARLVVSVGALNLHHKRHDHLIDEVARLEHDGLHLLIAGAADPEADLVRALAAERLADRATVVTVQPEEIATVYQAADVFALASLVEGFGLAAAEAASAGLPVIVHDGPVQRWVLGGSAAYVDMRVEGQLASSLCAVLSGDCAAPGQQVQQRFGPDALRTEHRAAIDRALELRGAR